MILCLEAPDNIGQNSSEHTSSCAACSRCFRGRSAVVHGLLVGAFEMQRGCSRWRSAGTQIWERAIFSTIRIARPSSQQARIGTMSWLWKNKYSGQLRDGILEGSSAWIH